MIITRHGIKCIAYVHTADGLKDVDELNAEQRKRLATQLKLTWMNELYRGRAVFTPAEQDGEVSA